MPRSPQVLGDTGAAVQQWVPLEQPRWGWSWVPGATDQGLRSHFRGRPKRPELLLYFHRVRGRGQDGEHGPRAGHPAPVQGQVSRLLGLQGRGGTSGQSPFRGHQGLPWVLFTDGN